MLHEEPTAKNVKLDLENLISIYTFYRTGTNQNYYYAATLR